MLTCGTNWDCSELNSLVPLVLCHVCFCHARLYKRECLCVCEHVFVCECSFACINVSESHQSSSVLSCAFSLLVCVCVSLAIGTQRRRSPSAIASEIFEPHLGSHILQVGTIHSG